MINRPLRRFLIVWLIAYPAMNGFATLFPVAMTHEFGMDPLMPSISYAVGVGGQPAAVCAGWAVRHIAMGGGRILLLGLGARLVLLGALAWPGC